MVEDSPYLHSFSMSRSCTPSVLFFSFHLDVARGKKYQFHPSRSKDSNLCYCIEQNEEICKVEYRFQSKDNLFQYLRASVSILWPTSLIISTSILDTLYKMVFRLQNLLFH